jgi:hypothetical protein
MAQNAPTIFMTGLPRTLFSHAMRGSRGPQALNLGEMGKTGIRVRTILTDRMLLAIHSPIESYDELGA